MTDNQPLRLPAPPDGYDDAQREAWYAGAQRVLVALGKQCEMMVAAYDNGPTEANNAPDSDTPPDACPACDDGTVEQTFGTRRCRDCGHTPQEAP
jgi:hypothetical protein